MALGAGLDLDLGCADVLFEAGAGLEDLVLPSDGKSDNAITGLGGTTG